MTKSVFYVRSDGKVNYRDYPEFKPLRRGSHQIRCPQCLRKRVAYCAGPFQRDEDRDKFVCVETFGGCGWSSYILPAIPRRVIARRQRMERAWWERLRREVRSFERQEGIR